MFKFLDNLAFKITKENWGFPWHIIIAMVLAECLFKVYFRRFDNWHIPFAIFIVWFVVNAIGLLYEMWQRYLYGNSRTDFWQDMLANNIGFILGVLLA